MFPAVAYLCYCFHHMNEVENLPSLAATSWHEAGVMEESGLFSFSDDDTQLIDRALQNHN